MTETTKYLLHERGVIGSICEMSRDPDKMLTAIRLAFYHEFKNLALDRPGEQFEHREVRLQFLKENGIVAHVDGDFLILSSNTKKGFERIRLHKSCVEGQI